MLNPITPHGSVVVNAGYDYCAYRKNRAQDGSDNDNFCIKKKDLVFCNKKSAKRKRTAYNEPDIHVVATTNGATGEDLKRENYAFIGISHAHLEPNTHRHTAVTVSGLTTIKNTGTTRIEAGDKIVWDIADHSSRSQKKRKVFQTVPYTKAFDEGVNNLFEDVLAAFDGRGGEDAKLCKEMFMKTGVGNKNTFIGMKDFLKTYVKAMSSLNSRVIGTALSRAEEGGEFDILLRHAH
jgi:hypothetical protein